jgi:ribonucleoside-diphosphate reductase alpha chain
LKKNPYTYATARLLMYSIAKEVLGKEVTQAEMASLHRSFRKLHEKGR